MPEFHQCRIADGLSPLDPTAVQLAAGKILLKEIQSNIKKGRDFAFESTLSGRAYIRLLKTLRSKAWKIILFYLWIPSAEFSSARVKQRVEAGGHNIPADAIARRYIRTVPNFINVFIPMCDEVMCYNNARTEPIPVFAVKGGERTGLDADLYQLILESGRE